MKDLRRSKTRYIARVKIVLIFKQTWEKETLKTFSSINKIHTTQLLIIIIDFQNKFQFLGRRIV